MMTDTSGPRAAGRIGEVGSATSEPRQSLKKGANQGAAGSSSERSTSGTGESAAT